MKLLVIKNQYTGKTKLDKYLDWFKDNDICEIEKEEIEVNIPVTTYKVNNATFSGVIADPTLLIAELKKIVPENKYHAVAVYNENLNGIRVSWTSGDFYKDTEIIQLRTVSDNGKDLNHELFHALVYRAKKRGYNTEDVMDTYLNNSNMDLSDDTNRSRQLAILKPYLNKIFDFRTDVEVNNSTMNIIKKTTPNYSVGRSGYKPELIVLHIMDGTLAGTDSWFASASSQVSAHYGIGKTGEIHQYVDEANKAWHAGTVSNPSFKLYKAGVNPNLYTIGIEHEGQPLVNDVWPDAMKKASAELVADICKRNNIAIDRDHIIGHYQIRSTKPNCPAVNKSVIDEIIYMAKEINDPSPTDKPITTDEDSQKSDIKKAVDLVGQAVELLKKYI